MRMVKCDACGGSGQTEGLRCDACRGNGLVQAEDRPLPDPESVRSLLEAVKVIPLRPGDVIVGKVPAHMTAEQSAHLRELFAGVFEGHRCVILSGGIDIEVVRREDAES